MRPWLGIEQILATWVGVGKQYSTELITEMKAVMFTRK